MLGLDEEPDKTIKLIVDDTSYNISIKLLRYCGIIQKTIESDETVEVIELDLPHVHKKQYAIQKTLDYLQYHEKNPISVIIKPLIDTLIESNVNEWDIRFINSVTTKDDLYDLIYVSNYLECIPLLELASAKLAIIIKDIILGKDTVLEAANAICVKFEIPAVFNPEKIKEFQGRKRNTKGIRKCNTKGIRKRNTKGMRKRK